MKTTLPFVVLLTLGVGASCGSELETARDPIAPSPSALLEEVPTTTRDTISPVPQSSSDSQETTTSDAATSATTNTPSATQPSDWPLALAVLDVMIVAPEYSSGYQRDLFPHWTVINSCSTRERVLIEESTSFAQVDVFGCRVVAGDWVSSFDGRMWDDPAEIQIDHLVALKEAWESGAWAWTENQRRAFANDMEDPRPLNAVTSSVNQSKSDHDPPRWLPPLESARCQYISDWIAVKARWQLTMDTTEKTFLQSYLRNNCPDQRVAPWETVPVSTSTDTPAPSATINNDGGTSGSVYYANCTEARAAGAAPILVGEPGYRTALDRDKDGIACE